jgi:hypothetical protein
MGVFSLNMHFLISEQVSQIEGGGEGRREREREKAFLSRFSY